ncbi:hypothetical protein [Rhizobium phaseoli]|uniref:hypothetical protein n=1 Tax=Rhizobium phaseoli TaxID=396 RepID=UPI00167A2C3D|nr:hypothetical protein [Rhizobium phaseoli]
MGSYTWKSDSELEYVSNGGHVTLYEKAWQTLGVELDDYSLNGYLSGNDVNHEEVRFDRGGLMPQRDEPRYILRGKGKLEGSTIQVTAKPGLRNGAPVPPRDNFEKDITEIIVDIRSTTGEETGQLANFRNIKQTADSLHLILKIPEARMMAFVTDLRHGGMPSLSVAFHVVLFGVKHESFHYLLPINPLPRTPAALNCVAFTYKRDQSSCQPNK